MNLFMGGLLIGLGFMQAADGNTGWAVADFAVAAWNLVEGLR